MFNSENYLEHEYSECESQIRRTKGVYIVTFELGDPLAGSNKNPLDNFITLNTHMYSLDKSVAGFIGVD